MIYWTFLLGLVTVYATLDINPIRIVIVLAILGFCVLAYRDLNAALDAMKEAVSYERTPNEPHGAEGGP